MADPFIQQIGQGGFGRAFLLKNYHPPIVMKEIDQCQNPTKRQMELLTLKELAHPNIVKYLDRPLDFEYNGGHFPIFMEYCEEGSLRKVITNKELNYSVATTVQWAKEIFTALCYLKTKSIVHLDIKPENIFVTKDFALKIGDFGVIKRFQANKTTPNGLAFSGTWIYMMPETKTGIKLSEEDIYKCDVYATGLLLWELIERRDIVEEVERIRFFPTDCKNVQKLYDFVESCSSPNIGIDKRVDADQALKEIIHLEELFRAFEITPEIKRNQKWLKKPEGLNLMRIGDSQTFLPPNVTFSEPKPTEDVEAIPSSDEIAREEDPNWQFFLYEIAPKILRHTNFKYLSVKNVYPSPPNVTKTAIHFEICSEELCNVNQVRGELSNATLTVISFAKLSTEGKRVLIKEIQDLLKILSTDFFHNNLNWLQDHHYMYEKRNDLSEEMVKWLEKLSLLISYDYFLQHFSMHFAIHTLWLCDMSAIFWIDLLDLLDLAVHHVEETANVFSRRETYLLYLLDDSKYEWFHEFGLIFRKDLNEFRLEDDQNLYSLSDLKSEPYQTTLDLEKIRRSLLEKRDIILRYSRAKEIRKVDDDPLKGFYKTLVYPHLDASFSKTLKNGLKGLPTNSQELKTQVLASKVNSRFPATVYFFDSIPGEVIFPTCTCSPPCPTAKFSKNAQFEHLQIKYSTCSKLNQLEFLETHSFFERAFRLLDGWENLILCHGTHLFLIDKLLKDIENLNTSFGFFFLYLEEEPWPKELLKPGESFREITRPMRIGIAMGKSFHNRTSFWGKDFRFEPSKENYSWKYRGLLYVSLVQLVDVVKVMAGYLLVFEKKSDDWQWKVGYKRLYRKKMTEAIEEFWRNQKLITPEEILK